MKKSTTLLLIMSFALLVLSGCNEKKSEPAAVVPVQSIKLSVSSYVFSDFGETLQLEAKVLPENATNPKVTWKSSNTAVATVSDNGLVTSVGNGTAAIAATADGIIEMCDISVDDNTINDICGNTYKYVKIGNQVWMAENMRCNKYDTQSERAGATLSTSSSSTYAPYYTDASDKSLWNSNSQKYGANLTSEQIGKLGYLYNWAAAVGIATAEDAEAQTSKFSTNRQGICPNGWHVPTSAEWNTLKDYLGSNAGKKLKSTSGWYNGGNGTDEYSFAALPAGFAGGSSVDFVGYLAYFWSATPNDSYSAYVRNLGCSSDGLYSDYNDKDGARSVRCVRN